jgi:hypothetical protein
MAVGSCVLRQMARLVDYLGLSTLMTRAPRSARCRVASGAASACSSDTTVIPCKGSNCCILAVGRQDASIPGIAMTSLRVWVRWWRGTESNCRHYDFQSYALPTELPRHDGCWYRGTPIITINRRAAQCERGGQAPTDPPRRQRRDVLTRTLNSPYAVAVSADSRVNPSSRRTRSSIALQTAGFSLRNCFAFSRPWPSRSPP